MAEEKEKTNADTIPQPIGVLPEPQAPTEQDDPQSLGTNTRPIEGGAETASPEQVNQTDSVDPIGGMDQDTGTNMWGGFGYGDDGGASISGFGTPNDGGSSVAGGSGLYSDEHPLQQTEAKLPDAENQEQTPIPRTSSEVPITPSDSVSGFAPQSFGETQTPTPHFIDTREGHDHLVGGGVTDVPTPEYLSNLAGVSPRIGGENLTSPPKYGDHPIQQKQPGFFSGLGRTLSDGAKQVVGDTYQRIDDMVTDDGSKVAKRVIAAVLLVAMFTTFGVPPSLPGFNDPVTTFDRLLGKQVAAQLEGFTKIRMPNVLKGHNFSDADDLLTRGVKALEKEGWAFEIDASGKLQKISAPKNGGVIDNIASMSEVQFSDAFLRNTANNTEGLVKEFSKDFNAAMKKLGNPTLGERFAGFAKRTRETFQGLWAAPLETRLDQRLIKNLVERQKLGQQLGKFTDDFADAMLAELNRAKVHPEDLQAFEEAKHLSRSVTDDITNLASEVKNLKGPARVEAAAKLEGLIAESEGYFTRMKDIIAKASNRLGATDEIIRLSMDAGKLSVMRSNLENLKIIFSQLEESLNGIGKLRMLGKEATKGGEALAKQAENLSGKINDETKRLVTVFDDYKAASVGSRSSFLERTTEQLTKLGDDIAGSIKNVTETVDALKNFYNSFRGVKTLEGFFATARTGLDGVSKVKVKGVAGVAENLNKNLKILITGIDDYRAAVSTVAKTAEGFVEAPEAIAKEARAVAGGVEAAEEGIKLGAKISKAAMGPAKLALLKTVMRAMSISPLDILLLPIDPVGGSIAIAVALIAGNAYVLPVMIVYLIVQLIIGCAGEINSVVQAGYERVKSAYGGISTWIKGLKSQILGGWATDADVAAYMDLATPRPARAEAFSLVGTAYAEDNPVIGLTDTSIYKALALGDTTSPSYSDYYAWHINDGAYKDWVGFWQSVANPIVAVAPAIKTFFDFANNLSEKGMELVFKVYEWYREIESVIDPFGQKFRDALWDGLGKMLKGLWDKIWKETPLVLPQGGALFEAIGLHDLQMEGCRALGCVEAKDITTAYNLYNRFADIGVEQYATEREQRSAFAKILSPFTSIAFGASPPRIVAVDYINNHYQKEGVMPLVMDEKCLKENPYNPAALKELNPLAPENALIAQENNKNGTCDTSVLDKVVTMMFGEKPTLKDTKVSLFNVTDRLLTYEEYSQKRQINGVPVSMFDTAYAETPIKYDTLQRNEFRLNPYGDDSVDWTMSYCAQTDPQCLEKSPYAEEDNTFTKGCSTPYASTDDVQMCRWRDATYATAQLLSEKIAGDVQGAGTCSGSGWETDTEMCVKNISNAYCTASPCGDAAWNLWSSVVDADGNLMDSVPSNMKNMFISATKTVSSGTTTVQPGILAVLYLVGQGKTTADFGDDKDADSIEGTCGGSDPQGPFNMTELPADMNTVLVNVQGSCTLEGTGGADNPGPGDLSLPKFKKIEPDGTEKEISINVYQGFCSTSDGPDPNYRHKGVDFSLTNTINIYAADTGTVIDVNDTCPRGNPDDSCGNYLGNKVVIDIGDGLVARYGHLLLGTIPDDIKVGAQVSSGQLLGRMGSSGSSSGDHLHYEVRCNNSPVNPYSITRAMCSSGSFDSLVCTNACNSTCGCPDWDPTLFKGCRVGP